jgi:hypothetical protein
MDRTEEAPAERGNWMVHLVVSAGFLALIAMAVMTVTRPAYKDLAYNEAVELQKVITTEGVNMTEADSIFVSAVADIREARWSILGLFPRYDLEKLTSAESKLSHAAETSDNAFLTEQARYLHAAVQLGLEEMVDGCNEMTAISQGRGPRAEDATRVIGPACASLP